MKILVVLTLLFAIANGKAQKPIIETVIDLGAGGSYEIVVFVNDVGTDLGRKLEPIESAIRGYNQINENAGSTLSVIPFPWHPSRKLIFSSTGSLKSDISDSRLIYDAAMRAMNRVNKLGIKRILLVVGPMKTASPNAKWIQGYNPFITACLGALHALYNPLQEREMTGVEAKFIQLGLVGASYNLMRAIRATASGVGVMRDIGNADSERMAAPRVAEYMMERSLNWKDTGITVRVENVDKNKHPLAWTVNRAAERVERHFGKVIYLEYSPPSQDYMPVNETLLLVGKGVTIDTGGADLRIDGKMYGMHREKMGAGFVAGFFEVLAQLRPMGLKVFGYMPMIRNSIGKLAYLPDELVVARNGMRARIGNTDAEGRMIMADVLYEAREQALKEVNPRIFTIATLTDAAVKAFGTITVSMDNGPARSKEIAESLSAAGDNVADPSEIARVRIEDFQTNYPISDYEDIMQFNTKPGSTSSRGFTFPMGFLSMISDIDKHGLDSSFPIPYTHSDIAPSAGGIGTLGTGSPLRMYANRFILPRFLAQNP